ncbi:hypothetical protein T484DRAFT_3308293 [Baffinella frigidus]|nr:hypothetical protein T484DRAFT_3308293 [Cryptophyta sp. CCMP2293]|mmetsp:Transcript_33664/g.79691  ORF Transcript_33664/g.79691 Transcript_33664/m.79691 type:complete len:299 (-) Transcript_33664:55-951(-)
MPASALSLPPRSPAAAARADARERASKRASERSREWVQRLLCQLRLGACFLRPAPRCDRLPEAPEAPDIMRSRFCACSFSVCACCSRTATRALSQFTMSASVINDSTLSPLGRRAVACAGGEVSLPLTPAPTSWTPTWAALLCPHPIVATRQKPEATAPPRSDLFCHRSSPRIARPSPCMCRRSPPSCQCPRLLPQRLLLLLPHHHKLPHLLPHVRDGSDRGAWRLLRGRAWRHRGLALPAPHNRRTFRGHGAASFRYPHAPRLPSRPQRVLWKPGKERICSPSTRLRFSTGASSRLF